MTSSCATTLPAANDDRRRLLLHRQRNRWHRCVVRQQRRRLRNTAETDLLDRLIAANQRELEDGIMTDSPTHPDTPPPLRFPTVSDDDSLFSPPIRCDWTDTSSDASSFSFSSISTSSSDTDDDESSFDPTDVYIDFSQPPPPGSLLSFWDTPFQAGTFGDFSELFSDGCKATTDWDSTSDTDLTQPIDSDCSIDSGDSFLTAAAPTLARISATVRVIRIDHESSELIDSGGIFNMCNDLSLLVNVRAIRPFGVTMAASTSQSSTTCTHCGDFALPMLDGSVLHTPMYYNPGASDCIISPEAVCLASNGILDSWQQSGSISDGCGSISLFDVKGVCRICLPLTKRNGLYYSTISSLAVDRGPPLPPRFGNRTVYYHEDDFSDSELSLELEPTAATTLSEEPATAHPLFG